MRLLLITILFSIFSAAQADNPQLMNILKKKCKDEVKRPLCSDSGEGILLIHCLAAQTDVSADCKASMDILLKEGDLPPEPPEPVEEKPKEALKVPEKPVELGEIPTDPGVRQSAEQAAESSVEPATAKPVEPELPK